MTEKKEDDLKRVLGVPPPPAFKRLAAKDRKLLAAQIEAALDKQIDAINRAEENVLQHLPRPLRGAVRRLLKVPERR